jgi:broad specificity phosphatase PhoE
MTTRLLLVRHGETHYNYNFRALGRADLPLTDTGRRQAECLREALASTYLDAIYSSPLVRARETAARIAETQGIDIHVEDGLIEMDIGDVEGLTFPEIRAKFPALAKNWGGADGPTFQMPGGERLIDVQGRAIETIDGLAARHPDQTTCLVTHNFVILSFLASVLDIELADFRRLRHGVAAITEVDVRPGRSRVIRLNDTCHLHGLG